MAQNKQSAPQKPENDDTPTSAQNTDGSSDDTELAAAVASQVQPEAPEITAPAETPGDTVKLDAGDAEPDKTEKPKPAAQKTAAAKSDDEDGGKARKRSNGKGQDDDEPVRRDRQIAQARRQDDDPGFGRQVRRDDDYERPAARRDTEQRNLFGDEDDGYYDRRARQQPQGRDDDYDRGRRAAQGYGHSSAQNNDERFSREYGSDYRRYSDAGYDDRSPYRGERGYDEGGQYRQRPYQGARPNDNGRDFEREAREQPRNRWRESNVDPRYDDAYDNHRNRSWSSQGNQDRHRDWDRDQQGRYSNERYRDEGNYRGQDRGYDQSSDRFGTRGYGNQNERGLNEPGHLGEPVAGNRSNYPAAREDDRGNPGRLRDERRDYRENEADDRYEYNRTPWRRR